MALIHTDSAEGGDSVRGHRRRALPGDSTDAPLIAAAAAGFAAAGGVKIRSWSGRQAAPLSEHLQPSSS